MLVKLQSGVFYWFYWSFDLFYSPVHAGVFFLGSNSEFDFVSEPDQKRREARDERNCKK